MAEPTDQELLAEWDRVSHIAGAGQRRLACLRAVLAKWGTPQPVVREPLTPREMELIDGMIQVQLDHASRCDAIANRSMADKQKGWDMERVALLQKFKAHGIKGD